MHCASRCSRVTKCTDKESSEEIKTFYLKILKFQTYRQ